jgi:hypothetical protein
MGYSTPMQRLSRANAESGNTRIEQKPQHWECEQKQRDVGKSPVTKESDVPNGTLDWSLSGINALTSNGFAPTYRYSECSSRTKV